MNKISYYIMMSYRRKILDKLLQDNLGYFKGKVLDIGGGRKRGNFIPPASGEWLFADIVPEFNPDIICSVEKLPFEDGHFDNIKATELFEHVKNPEQGIRECFRVLKSGGHLIASEPFLYPIHGDPCDYQRWTEEKWKMILLETGFEIEKIEIMGGFFTVLGDMLKNANKNSSLPCRYFGYAFYPIIDILVRLDNMRRVKKSILGKYTGGYFIIAKK